MRAKRICAVLLAAAAVCMAGCASVKEAGNTNAPGQEAPSAVSKDAVSDEQAGADAQERETQTEQPPETETAVLDGSQETGGEEMTGNGIIEVPEWNAVEIPENDALEFVAAMQLGWNLGNTFDASNCGVQDELAYESAWCGVVTTREMIHTIAASGFKTIRIPVSWHNHVDENNNISEAWLARVQEVVDWALEEDLYVILNIHHDNEKGFMYPSYEELDRSKAYVRKIWEQVAARFADYDERLIFETLNEPRQTETDHEWWIDVRSDIGKECIDSVNQLNQTAVDAIRENGQGYNTTRYIMVPGYCASPDFALADGFVLPEDKAAAENRLLVSVHAYTPYNFALAAESDQNSTEVFSIANKKGTADIDMFMKKLYDKFISKGTAVVIGEFGARSKNNNLEARKEFSAYYVARARYYGITACVWDNNAFGGDGENFGLFRRVKNQILFPEIVEQMVHYSKAE